MRKLRAGVALSAALGSIAGALYAAPQIQPGMALSPDDLPSDAERYEGLLGSGSGSEPAGANDDTVDERRHFDDQIFHVGVGTGFGTPVGMIGAFVEANPWDRIALGLGGGVSLWGPAGGVFARLRPVVWGGQGLGVLHAFTLQTSYTYMRDGELDLVPCIHACTEVGFSNRSAQFGALSAGFEHRLVSGWTFRYDFGAAHAWFASPWRCARYDTGAAAPCPGAAPGDTLFVSTFGISHGL